jgi:hypothetical protein
LLERHRKEEQLREAVRQSKTLLLELGQIGEEHILQQQQELQLEEQKS